MSASTSSRAAKGSTTTGKACKSWALGSRPKVYAGSPFLRASRRPLRGLLSMRFFIVLQRLNLILRAWEFIGFSDGIARFGVRHEAIQWVDPGAVVGTGGAVVMLRRALSGGGGGGGTAQAERAQEVVGEGEPGGGRAHPCFSAH